MTAHPLKAFRENSEPKLSQAALADLLEVSRLTVNRWERGVRKVDIELLPRVSERTGVAASALRPDLAELMGEAS